ncbi:nucleotidyl transferase AbiEii/AbiGii toxin family protein [Desulfosarcina sp. OttesenSCG-928-B08]|nr:nucleotidyl transferase AbiEii/AbiGii toxin family protein [Desulfosarcina sp. OttesenSCG-928-B08]
MIWDVYARQARLLLHILSCLDYETLAGEPFFALKGGTALNFFVQPFPRLSVDIDLTYCPLDERDAALAAMCESLQRLTDALQARLPGIQCTHTRPAGGDKLLVRFDGASVKVEPNGVIRGTVFPTEIRSLHLEAQTAFGVTVNARCLGTADLYGGKICAALDRQHPRDLFDILPLMQAGNLEENMRKAFLVYALSHPRPLAELLDPRPQPLERIFQTEFFGMTSEPVALKALEEARMWLIQAVRSCLTADERRFLLTCKAGEPDWRLSGLPAHVPQLPAVRWKLHNIATLQRQPEKHKAALAKLEKRLNL